MVLQQAHDISQMQAPLKADGAHRFHRRSSNTRKRGYRLVLHNFSPFTRVIVNEYLV